MSPPEKEANLDIDALVDLHYRRIYKLALFYLKNEPDAEDLTQAVFEKIYRKRDQFRGEADPFTWVYRTAVRTALNHLRRKKLLQWLSLDDELIGTILKNRPSGADDPARNLEMNEERKRKLDMLERGIGRLSAREKTAFYLFYYDRVPQKKIAEIMSASVAAVESMVHKALKKIKKNWQGFEPPTVQ